MNAHAIYTEVACHACGGEGYQEFDSWIDPDAIEFGDCDHCSGTGKEPWRPAGQRDTGPRPVMSLNLIDAAGHVTLVSGDILDVLKAARTHWNRQWYAWLRAQAMRPVVMQLTQADMLARAEMCATAADRSVQAWRAVA